MVFVIEVRVSDPVRLTEGTPTVARRFFENELSPDSRRRIVQDMRQNELRPLHAPVPYALMRGLGPYGNNNLAEQHNRQRFRTVHSQGDTGVNIGARLPRPPRVMPRPHPRPQPRPQPPLGLRYGRPAALRPPPRSPSQVRKYRRDGFRPPPVINGVRPSRRAPWYRPAAPSMSRRSGLSE